MEQQVRTMRKAIQSALAPFAILQTLGILLIWGTSRYAESLQILPASEYLVPLFNGFGMVSIGLAISKLLINIFDPHGDTKQLMTEVLLRGSAAAAIVYAGRCILAGMIIFVLSTSFSGAHAQALTTQAKQYVPLLQQERAQYWPDLKKVSYMAGQIEQESNWKPTAELKTSREHGVGFGQQTIAWSSSGAVRFDALTDIVKKYPKDLAGYSWKTWKEVPHLQMRATVLMTRDICKQVKDTATQDDMFRMCLAAYNGGKGGLDKDRLSCRSKEGCNPAIWYANVEYTSLKSKVPMNGYGGQSPYSINRGYVVNIDKRSQKYRFADLI